MTAVHNITLPAVAVLWCIVVLRLAGLPRGGSRRLALILLLLATIFTIKLNFVGPAIDVATGVVGMQVLVREVLGISFAAIAAHTVAGVVRGVRSPAWSVVASVAVVLAAVTFMAVLFVAVGPEREGILHLVPASSRPIQTAYWLSYTIPYGFFLLVTAAIALSDMTRSEPWTRGRTGLLFFGLGSVVGVIYVVAKLVVVTQAASSAWLLRHEALVQGVPSLIAVVLVVGGAATWADIDLRARWLHLRLASAHRELTHGLLMPRTVGGALSPAERLDRRVIEIGEAILRLQAVPDAFRSYLPDAPPAAEPVALLHQVARARRIATAHQRSRVARAVTEALAPPMLAVAMLLALGLRDGAVGWAIVGAFFVAGLPYAVVIIGVRRGVWRDRMLTTRRERLIPVLSNIAFALAGLGILTFSPAPRELAALLTAAIATQAVLFVVTLFWKISFHSGVAAGLLTIAGMEFGWLPVVLLAPLVIVVGWSRVQLREHTLAQVLAGAPVCSLLLGCAYRAALALL